MPDMTQPRTASSVAIEVDMSPRTIKRWCRDGKISTVGKLDGSTGAWLIGPEGVEQARRLAEITKQLDAAHKGAAA